MECPWLHLYPLRVKGLSADSEKIEPDQELKAIFGPSRSLSMTHQPGDIPNVGSYGPVEWTYKVICWQVEFVN